MLSVDEARARVLEGARPLGEAFVWLEEGLGRALSRPVRSRFALPPFDNSAMDGYAARWSELGEGVTLPVALEAAAGSDPGPLPPGCAARIMTGGRLPEGADTVVMREDTREEGARVTFVSLPRAGRGAHIRRRGEVLGEGEVALEAGSVLDAGSLGLLAGAGHARVAVWRRPRVALLTTGDELVEPGSPLGPGEIVNSSKVTLGALLRAAGAEVWALPAVRDEEGPLREAFEAALASADVVVSTGGVSVGDRDRVREVIEALCGGLVFWKVRMKPGKPLAFGRAGRVPVLGLPGNPVSAAVSFWVFVWPLLRRMQGQGEALEVVEARLEGAVSSTASRLELARGWLRWEREGWWFRACAGQGSAELRSLVGVNGLALIPEGCEGLEAGAAAQVWRLPS